MAFVTKDLSVLAYANGFTLWHYATEDTAATAMKTGYFDAAADMIRVGDMILTNATTDTGEPMAAILLVGGKEKGVVTVASLTQPLESDNSPAAGTDPVTTSSAEAA